MNKKFLDSELHDGPGEAGGISFRGETLLDFLEETGISTDTFMEEINKALVECGILPILEFVWKMNPQDYELNTKKMLVDNHIGDVYVGDICINIIIRDYGDTYEQLAYSFDLYVAGENTGYGYKELKDGSVLPYDYAEGDDIWVSNLPTDFEEFKKEAEEMLTYYIATNDTRFGGTKSYSLVKKASQPLNIW